MLSNGLGERVNLLNFFKRIGLKHQVLLAALAVSMLVHIVLIAKFEWYLPNLDQGVQGLEVRLVPLPASSAVIAKAELPQPPTPEPKVEPNETLHEIVPETQVEQPALETVTPLEPNALTQTAAVGQAVPTRPETTPYQFVETTFDVKLKSASVSPSQSIENIVGDVVIANFRVDKNGTYMLTTYTHIVNLENKHLAAINHMKQLSEGVVTAAGLVPGSYLSQQQDDANTIKHIRFAWQDSFVQFKAAGVDKVEPLAFGTLDGLSMLYQFMFLPPVDTAKMTVAGEANQAVVDFSVITQEEISTEFGQLRTLHLVKTSAEGIWQEIWLAMDYQYLPVKMIKNLENGEQLELTVKNMVTTAF